ncbi:hypothetical protein WDU94_005709 [Cyamophila willieti]
MKAQVYENTSEMERSRHVKDQVYENTSEMERSRHVKDQVYENTSEMERSRHVKDQVYENTSEMERSRHVKDQVYENTSEMKRSRHVKDQVYENTSESERSKHVKAQVYENTSERERSKHVKAQVYENTSEMEHSKHVKDQVYENTSERERSRHVKAQVYYENTSEMKRPKFKTEREKKLWERKNKLIVYGIPNRKNENMSQTVEEIGHKLDIVKPLSQVQMAYRIVNETRRVHPILLELVNLYIKARWINAYRKKKLWREKWFLHEYSPNIVRNLVAKTKQWAERNKFKHVFSRNGTNEMVAVIRHPSPAVYRDAMKVQTRGSAKGYQCDVTETHGSIVFYWTVSESYGRR